MRRTPGRLVNWNETMRAIKATPTSNTSALGPNAGTAAVEFGLAIPFLLILLVGTVEIGSAMYQAMQVHNAAEAGMVYAGKHGWNASSIAAAVTASGVSGVTATPAPTQFCGCPTASGITVVACGATCTVGTAGAYVQINASIPHQTILPYPSIPLPATLTARSILRIN